MGRARDAEAELNLPPGFRFHPTDEELVVHYLCRKASYQCLPVPIIAEVDLYKYDPWQLPEKALFGTKEWYFFTPRDRKYPNGSRPNRAAGRGYWKATGADKPIRPTGSARHVGIKKALVFYCGKAPKGIKTNWIMHEYRLTESNLRSNKNGSLRLDDWVLCRIYNKKNNWVNSQQQKEEDSHEETMDSFEAVETGSESFRTPESDVDNDPFTDINDMGVTEVSPSQALHIDQVSRTDTKGSFQMGECVKEDSVWFSDLNLDDLQNSFAVLGATPTLDVAIQDYYYLGLCSPQLKPYQDNQFLF
ncbi:PREDICTED: NAC domain-containing protein 68-like [Nelumbo nucifera]|uniref:NAC domain-containing protein 68-like n=2 Tax=Nelumbo nucifera TaxID=4432 RepID=A0A1U8A8B4_NELNU|nr:PREDICTED: NAC domain-containing protein 68-like [Nelumbo nucifera]DAD42013.1 TPA_asm: hypothetical protein HUJ06_000243 [Nelumbo nucifera]